MKRIILLGAVFILMAGTLSISEIEVEGKKKDNAVSTVSLNKKNFPDKEIRNFLKKWSDKNKDGILNKKELKKAIGITISGSAKTNWKGIEKLPYLKNILFTETNKKDISLKDISNVKNVYIADCERVQKIEVKNCKNLKNIQISGNPELIDVKLKKVKKVNQLCVQCCPKVESVRTNNLPNLKEFKCVYTAVTKLDVRKNRKLENLECNNNQLKGLLDVSKCPKLYNLECSDNWLTGLDLRNTSLWRCSATTNSLEIVYAQKLKWGLCYMSNNPNMHIYLTYFPSEGYRWDTSVIVH